MGSGWAGFRPHRGCAYAARSFDNLVIWTWFEGWIRCPGLRRRQRLGEGGAAEVKIAACLARTAAPLLIFAFSYASTGQWQ